MRCKRAIGIVIIFILSLIISICMSRDTLVYSVKAGDYTMEFVPSPELGYVVKSSGKISALQQLNKFVSSKQSENKKYLKILDRDDMIVVLDNESPSSNKNNISLLSHQSETVYVSPLFVLQGQMVVVMPDILVRLKNIQNYDALNELCSKLNCTISHKLLYTEKEYCISSSAHNAEEVFNAVEIFNLADFIEWATPSIGFQPMKFSESQIEYKGKIEPNDTYFNKQWHLDMIRAPEAWGYTSGNPNILVAVVDDGVQSNHPDMKDNIWTNPDEIPGNGIDDDGNYRIDDIHGWNFYNNNNDTEPRTSSDGHGTSCAGLIAAQGNNNRGVIGVAWNCKILPVKISYGGNVKTEESIASAIRYAAIAGADVISNSWGVSIDVPVIHSAIKDVTLENGIGRNGKGCVVLFSSGNWANGGIVSYPAKYQEVIAVGAVDPNFDVWYYSGSGSELDFVAPSGDAGLIGNMWTIDVSGSQGFNNRDPNIRDYTDRMGGTSGSCPLAAGVAALILSVNPDLISYEVKNIMADSALDLGTPGWDASYGYGCLDAYEAVSLALNPREIKIYVDSDAPSDPGPNNSSISDSLEDGSMEHPFDTIQEAINYSMFKDEIIVLPGQYTGQGNMNIDFSGKAITVRSQSGPETCIIDCQSQNGGFYFHNGEESHSVLDGFTIKNGKTKMGGGINIVQSCPTIKNCIISNNKATDGAGIAITECSVLITNCNFIGNVSDNSGGALYVDESRVILNNCTFKKNQSLYGGGLYSTKGIDMVLSNCAFEENKGIRNGGGIYTSNSISINDCTFTRNSVNGSGGGTYFNVCDGSVLNNCIFTENLAGKGGGLFNNKCNQTLNNCTFTKNSVNEEGGAIFNSLTVKSIISSCTFNENNANNGGGIYNSGAELQIIKCAFNQNTSTSGAGIYNFEGMPVIKSCEFTGNIASMNGGGIVSEASRLNIVNCILFNNIANSGGGVYGESIGYNISNCTFYGNTGGIYQGSSYCNVVSCILWNNSYDLGGQIYPYNCWIQSVWVHPVYGLQNPNTEEPLFTDPDKGDFHLKSQAGRWNSKTRTWVKDNVTSPCIDNGNENQSLESEVWPHGGRINIGAYGGTTQASMSQSKVGDRRDFNNNNNVTWDDVLLFAQDWNSNELPLRGDFDFNGKVDLNDLLVFYGNWKTSYVNDIPEIQNLNNQNVSKKELLTFSVSAIDNNGDTLKFAALGLPENATFSNQVFSWIPEQAGTYPITIIVSDNKSLNYKTIQIVVRNGK